MINDSDNDASRQTIPARNIAAAVLHGSTRMERRHGRRMRTLRRGMSLNPKL